MFLLNPKTEKFDHLDSHSADLMRKTIAFFESKGKRNLKHDDHERVWYQDFIDFQGQQGLFSTLMTPKEYALDEHARWDTHRICDFNEILGFYGLAYWYTWQVSMLGLGPIWISGNDEVKKQTAKFLKEGEVFAFGLSEQAHGADLISSEMSLTPAGDGKYTASGRKYYIGNANAAAFVSTFARRTDNGDYVFFVAEPKHERYNCIQNVTNSQNYVAEYELKEYPVTDAEILQVGRTAWDASLATIAFCKYNLGWASIGMCTHAFYESITHASNRILFGHAVTEFSQIKQYFVDAYCRLVSMKLFARRAKDYMRAASEEDKRYLLFNPMVKMKVTMQGEEVINLLWDIIAARGFEKDSFFEMAARDIRALPKLEGTAHVNMVLVIKFIQNYLFKPKSYEAVPYMDKPGDDQFLFQQGSTSKGQNKIQFHDYNEAYNSRPLPNVKIFQQQIEVLKKFLTECGPSKQQTRDLDFMLSLGEIFTLIPYGQLILENAKIHNLDDDLVDQIFDFMVRDFSRYALQVYSKTSSTDKQMEVCLEMLRKPTVDWERYERVWEKQVKPLNGAYAMNP